MKRKQTNKRFWKNTLGCTLTGGKQKEIAALRARLPRMGAVQLPKQKDALVR